MKNILQAFEDKTGQNLIWRQGNTQKKTYKIPSISNNNMADVRYYELEVTLAEFILWPQKVW
jgi:hypothetical protein